MSERAGNGPARIWVAVAIGSPRLGPTISQAHRCAPRTRPGPAGRPARRGLGDAPYRDGRGMTQQRPCQGPQILPSPTLSPAIDPHPPAHRQPARLACLPAALSHPSDATTRVDSSRRHHHHHHRLHHSLHRYKHSHASNHPPATALNNRYPHPPPPSRTPLRQSPLLQVGSPLFTLTHTHALFLT
ncbi:hypothetical protein DFH27DRAFT_611987 [Peziza echinospora]|nr:hypothetical protein DFH27DRAFT_611987 [Peziza echinospora]